METASFLDNVEYNPDKPAFKLLMETETSKEIRIAFRADQELKEHTAPFPISVEVIEGSIEFGTEGRELRLRRGDVIALAANVPHRLKSSGNSIVRLTLSKFDKTERLDKIVE